MGKLIQNYFSTNGVTSFKFGALEMKITIKPNQDDSRWDVTIESSYDEGIHNRIECITNAVRWFVGASSEYIMDSNRDVLHPIFDKIIMYLTHSTADLPKSCFTIKGSDDKITLNSFAALVWHCRNWLFGSVVSRHECK